MSLYQPFPVAQWYTASQPACKDPEFESKSEPFGEKILEKNKHKTKFETI